MEAWDAAEDVAGRVVGEAELAFGDGAARRGGEGWGEEDVFEVGVHAGGLFAGAGEDGDFDGWFVEEVEGGGDGGEVGLAGAAGGPDDGVLWGGG